jgi:hypothetical protein
MGSTDQILAVIALLFAVVGMVPWPRFTYNASLVAIAVILLAIALLVP